MNLSTNIALVDEHDELVGELDLLSAHKGVGKRHRATSVFLFNKNGELLLQQRSPTKIVGALQWTNSCCGNVRIGETYEQCARRRLKDELGITKVQLYPLYKFEYHVQCNDEFSEWEIDQVFVGMYDGAIKKNENEVLDTLWWNLDAVDELVAEGKRQFTPWFLIMKDEVIIRIRNMPARKGRYVG